MYDNNYYYYCDVSINVDVMIEYTMIMSTLDLLQHSQYRACTCTGVILPVALEKHYCACASAVGFGKGESWSYQPRPELSTPIHIAEATMESVERLKQFVLDGVIPVNPVDDVDSDIGHGSYGFVVEMNYRGLKCAGKKFHRDLYCQGDVEARECIITRCYEECQILCSLAHPNVVQFIGITFEKGNPLPVLVMEFVPFTLSTLLKEQGILPEDISYGILVDVAMGLCYLHGKTPAVIHRDLSANNILLSSEMKAKIADLGMAQILNATPAKSKCPGTVTYMPPEALVENPEYRTEIDLFSYGVLIIHVLCAHWPHPDLAKKHGKDGKLVAKSEFERRSKYIEMLGEKHPMIGLIQGCLCDIPAQRPNATAILRCVGASASRFRRPFESILEARKHERALTRQLESVRKELDQRHRDCCRIELMNDMLSAHLQQSKNEQSLLKKRLGDEKTIKRQHRTALQENQHALDLKDLETHSLEEQLRSQETEEKCTSVRVCRGKTKAKDTAKYEMYSLLDTNEKIKREQEQQLSMFKKALTETQELLQNKMLELRIVKECEIGTLEAELKLKDSYIRELLGHQQRAQTYLNSQVMIEHVGLPVNYMKFVPVDLKV